MNLITKLLAISFLLAVSIRTFASDLGRSALAVERLKNVIIDRQDRFSKLPASLHDLNWVRLKIHHLISIENIVDEALSVPGANGYTEIEQIDYTIRLNDIQRSVEELLFHDLVGILQVHRWLRADVFGSITESEAVAIVLHLDQHSDFQSRILEELMSLYRQEEVQGSSVAMLSDHLLLEKDTSDSRQFQQFGTQGACVSKGRWLPFPVADESCLDLRRSRYHLPTEKAFMIEMSQKCL